MRRAWLAVALACATFAVRPAVAGSPGGGPVEINVANNPEVVEGHLIYFDVTASANGTSPVTVEFSLHDGTATVIDGDYFPFSGTITFAAGGGQFTLIASTGIDGKYEADETFTLDLSNPSAGAVIVDGQGVGTILNDDVWMPTDLQHGTLVEQAFLAETAHLPVQVYRVLQRPRASYEIVLDEASGDITPVLMERLAPDFSTVLQTAAPVGTGQALSLRWENSATTDVVGFARLTAGGDCSVECGPDDVYRLRAFETTLAIPRFNNAASQVTILLLQNATGELVHATAYFWNPAGTLLAQAPITLLPRGLAVIDTTTVPGLLGQSGAVTITNDAPYGGLAGKAVALEPATGFSFDSPLSVRLH